MALVVLEIRAEGYMGAAGHGTKFRASEDGPERLKVYYRKNAGVGDRVRRLFGHDNAKEFGEAYLDREDLSVLHEKGVLISEEELRHGGMGSYSLYRAEE